MKRKDLNSDLVYDLINAFKEVRSVNESVEFLQDILTANEIRNLAIRLRIAKMILKNIPQRDISIDLKVSTSTVTKVSGWLNLKGYGFREVIKRLPEKVEMTTKIIRGPIEFQLPKILETTVKYAISKSQNKPAEKLIKNSNEKRFADKLHRMGTEDYFKHTKKT